ncbi:MAG: hypothetical protein Kow0069_09840 [Promethearchaeota archaeon]
MAERRITQQDLQRMALTIQQLENQASLLQQQLNYLGELMAGTQASRSAVEELKGAEPGQEIILPIGNSAFVRAHVDDPRKVLLAISPEVLVERDADDAARFLEEIARTHEANFKKLSEQFGKVQEQLQEVRPYFEAALRAAQQQQGGPGGQ